MNIEKIRVSIGSASVLGLYQSTKFKTAPTTCYLMTYTPGHCVANCGFCPQAKDARSSIDKLSRVSWPVFPFKDFIAKLNYLPASKQFKRICIQTLNYSRNFEDLTEIIKEIKKNTRIPISVAIPPMSKEKLRSLKILGVDKVGIALDGATPEVFEHVKGSGVEGPYNWKTHLEVLKDALSFFSRGSVTTHLIIGLGETPKKVLSLIVELNELGINIGLFAFTPIKGTSLEGMKRPELTEFRKIQLGRYLILKENKKINDFTFNLNGDIIKFNLNKVELWNIINETDAFLTSGCPGCNRPYYTSRPSGPTYNYPRKLTNNEKLDIYNSLLSHVR